VVLLDRELIEGEDLHSLQINLSQLSAKQPLIDAFHPIPAQAEVLGDMLHRHDLSQSRHRFRQ
jgi:hypothetical protein